MRLDKRLVASPQKQWVYYIALTADVAKWADERGMAEIIVDLAYGAADVMQEQAREAARAR